MIQSYTSENFGLGMSHIRITIELRLAEAGMRSEGNRVHIPKQTPRKPGTPTNIRMAVNCHDGARMTAEFTQQEILDCREGVLRNDVRDKIRLFVRQCMDDRRIPGRAAA